MPDHPLPVDPDQPISPSTASVLTVIAVGGAIGALARAGVAEALPHPRDGFDVATLVTNVVGSLLLGMLMVYVVEHERGHPLLRPFVGVGVLGGFTTFSTYTVHTRGLLGHDLPLALVEIVAGVVLCLVAVAAGVALMRRWGPR
ncbi:CrcB family protein [Luteipulveratus sp. YIM 133132]|uniref:Fluoride-specific ion channel FluC n=1 Tax=Luteipulveratus flavus TaxID=3031728 RepID=A0ABT6C3T5_9MICO|nr:MULTISPECIES: CrcB family protein [unclassified Luteipulveratus]MDE9364209.1 CrcB family protein [Luteipulveratus sp. YIM 133132]MDF8263629.1 CrcB family protein [Luteipulveratus sp. YIM 133296]